jgi:hypothetical protein
VDVGRYEKKRIYLIVIQGRGATKTLSVPYLEYLNARQSLDLNAMLSQ